MASDDSYDLGLFQDFIEAQLALDAFTPEMSAAVCSMLTISTIRLPDTHVELMHDIRAHFKVLLREQPGHDYWLQRLTPFEAKTRAMLLELLVATAGDRFSVDLPDEVLRGILNYALTSGWLVYTGLLDQYVSAASDGPSDVSDIPF